MNKKTHVQVALVTSNATSPTMMRLASDLAAMDGDDGIVLATETLQSFGARTSDADVVHVFDHAALRSIYKANPDSATRIVYSLDDTAPYEGLANTLTLRGARSLASSIGYVLPTTKATKLAALELGIAVAQRTKVMYLGTTLPEYSEMVQARKDRELSKRLDLPVADPVFIHLAEDTTLKDYKRLITAFAWTKAAEKRSTLVAFVRNRGPEAETLTKLAVDAGVGDSVKWLAAPQNKEDYYRYLASSDAVIMCDEGARISYPLLEAMAAGAVIVAADTPPVGEAIIPETNGLLAPANKPEQISDAMLSALELTRGQAQEWGDNARAGIRQRFALEKMVSKTLDIYRLITVDSL